jgi:hypothetical protein
MFGNAFRVYIDKEHTNWDSYQGRFDFEAQVTPNFDPQTPQLALMDLGAAFSTVRQGDPNPNARFNSDLGCHAAGPSDWWQVDMKGTSDYEVSGFTLKKRSNQDSQIITAVRFYTWNEEIEDYEWRDWQSTGLLASDDMFTERRIAIDPPLVGRIFRVVTDKDHTDGDGHERWTFDLVVKLILKD